MIKKATNLKLLAREFLRELVVFADENPEEAASLVDDLVHALVIAKHSRPRSSQSSKSLTGYVTGELHPSEERTVEETSVLREDKSSQSEFRRWKTRSGTKTLDFKGTEAVKQDPEVDLLLDEDGHVRFRGRDVTVFFKKRTIAYGLLQALLRNRGRISYLGLYRSWERLRQDRGRPLSPSQVPVSGSITRSQMNSLKRTVRHLNSVLKEIGLEDNLFIPGPTGFLQNTDFVLCAIESVGQ